MVYKNIIKIYKIYKINIKTGVKMEKYDLIMIGSGPAGLSAGIYAARFKLKTKIFGSIIGGTATEAFKVCNYPGYPDISGIELTQRMYEHLKSLDLNVDNSYIERVDILDDINYDEENNKEKNRYKFLIKTYDKEYYAKRVIIATGTEKKKLNIVREDYFLGKGISYCSTCDAAFYKNKVVGVVGGGDAALTSALLLTQFAKKVYIIYRRERFFRAEPTWTELVLNNPKIEPVFKSNVVELIGENKLEAVRLDSGKTIKLDGLFIEIGSIPNTKLIDHLNPKKEKGYLIVDKRQETSIKGLYAAGDITNNNLKQIIIAATEGVLATASVYEDISKEK